MDYGRIEKRIAKTPGLRRRPVAVKSLDAPPAKVEKFAGAHWGHTPLGPDAIFSGVTAQIMPFEEAAQRDEWQRQSLASA